MVLQTTVSPQQAQAARRTAWENLGLALIFLAGLALVLQRLPALWQKGPERYVLVFSMSRLLAFWGCFYGLYVLPGLTFLFWRGRGRIFNPLFSLHRFIIAFSAGMLAHIIAMLVQKHLHWGYSPLAVLVCLLVSYPVVLWLLPTRRLLEEGRGESGREGVVWVILLTGFLLSLELILRGRTSSVSLMGDSYPHLLGFVATQMVGPMPDGLPLLSTFVMNLQPMAFHALGVNLQTLLHIPALELLRYFSATMLPAVLLIFFALFSYVAKNRVVGALAAFAVTFIAGGGLSTAVPVVFFPWYWGLAWCLCGAFFYLLLWDDFKTLRLTFFLGMLLGGAVLFHPMVGLRMPPILFLFGIFELMRRLLQKEALKNFFFGNALLILGSALVVGAWLGPLLLRYPIEATYPYDFIVANFSERAPEAVDYVRRLKEERFPVSALFQWAQQFGGVWTWVLFPFGIFGLIRRWREPAAALLTAWVLAMASAIVFRYLPNPYRYFEYFFLGLLALSAFGVGTFVQAMPERWRAFALLPFVGLLLYSVGADYLPKYRLALNYYGQTAWPANYLQNSLALEARYRVAREKGTLDAEFGNFRGYLWSRQKKVWDIYLANHLVPPPVLPPQNPAHP